MTCACELSLDQAFHPALFDSHCASCSPSSSRSPSPNNDYDFSPPLAKKNKKNKKNKNEGVIVDFETGFLDLDAMVRLNGGHMTTVEYGRQMHHLHRQNELTRDQNMNFRKLHYEYNKFLDRDFIDLHFLPTVLAMQALVERLQEMIVGRRESVLYACMGVGNHSQDGISLIKETVIRNARKFGYTWKEMRGNAGVLIITLR